MAQKNTRKNIKKKTTAKSKSKFYVVKNVQEARKNLNSKLEDYNDNFINKPISKGKELVKDLKDDPRKTIGKLIDDGNDVVKDLKTNTSKKFNTIVKDGKDFISKTRKKLTSF